MGELIEQLSEHEARDIYLRYGNHAIEIMVETGVMTEEQAERGRANIFDWAHDNLVMEDTGETPVDFSRD